MNIFDSWTLDNWGKMPMTQKPPMLTGIHSLENIGPPPIGIMSSDPMVLAGIRSPEDVGPRPRGMGSLDPMAFAGFRSPEDIGPRPRGIMSPGSATAIPLGQAPNPISSTGEVLEDQELFGSSVPPEFSGLMNPNQQTPAPYGQDLTQLLYNDPTSNISSDDPEPKYPGSGRTDVSGFASYGMTTPELPDPMSQMKMLMSMNPPAQQKQQIPMGGLMSYLQQLGAI
jgi:hypothetical protein